MFILTQAYEGTYYGRRIDEGVAKRKQLFAVNMIGKLTTSQTAYISIVHAIGYCMKNNIENATIFCADKNAILWVQKGEHNSNTDKLKKESIDILDRADKFLHNLPILKFSTMNNVKPWLKEFN